MAAKKKEEGALEEPAVLVKFRFSKVWTSSLGCYWPGAVAELPREIAESLYLEEMGEIVAEEK